MLINILYSGILSITLGVLWLGYNTCIINVIKNKLLIKSYQLKTDFINRIKKTFFNKICLVLKI